MNHIFELIDDDFSCKKSKRIIFFINKIEFLFDPKNIENFHKKKTVLYIYISN